MTLRHIVSWKFNGETKEQRDAQAAEAIALIDPLREKIESVRALSLHRNELFDGANFDLTLIADFDDAEGLEFYAKHPEHQPALQYMPTVAAARVATDFTI
ncbi:Dabb family protein [Leucobacter sp. UT-8R-CII-1-4]|uniref:Dabb family protein n=1 Tax=Leucobacter sp. UT-8R-CII-1-4 TaxID=3040075 RepID=UPI0024A9C655|nr:Dabb family protein [Leucobacter sp. UT-8R-CII-1-4]MDI6023704.1 Dabb family protein [Leucobacter sp. UT-8R-CII-1-4]